MATKKPVKRAPKVKAPSALDVLTARVDALAAIVHDLCQQSSARVAADEVAVSPAKREHDRIYKP